jgi:hypothetical protein
MILPLICYKPHMCRKTFFFWFFCFADFSSFLSYENYIIFLYIYIKKERGLGKGSEREVRNPVNTKRDGRGTLDLL